MAALRELPQLIDADRRDVLSVALDVDPTKPEHQTPNPAYRIWVHQALARVLEAAPGAARRDIGAAAHRIQGRLTAGPVPGHGLVFLAAPDLWGEYALPDPVPNRILYGRPDLLPLLWAARVYRPWAMVLVDRTHAKVVVSSLEEMRVVADETLDLDTSGWRFGAGRPRTSTRATGVGSARGVARDRFDARVDELVHRFWQGIARTAADLSIDRVILAGPEKGANAVRDFLPGAVQASVVGILALHSHSTIAAARAEGLPMIVAHELQQESRLLADLRDRAGARAGGVLGLDATLGALARGEVMTLVGSRDLDASVWECPACSSVAAHPGACAACGGAVSRTSLRQILPVLARRHGARLEVVGPAAPPP
ncbi:MAG TPA: VLRF1 family aeRF1-type release factor, partial [bacterium]|nr:VLRF1 family aeRF1-type release factor [bacterium]